MSVVRICSSEEIATKVQAHCALGIKKGRSPDFPLIGCGNHELVTEIVLKAITWMDTPEKIEKRKRLSHQTLTWVVAAETYNLTRENFSWASVCKIIERASRVSKTTIDTFARIHAHAAGTIEYELELGGGISVKTAMSRLARAVLWVEACTFMIEEGYDYNENRF